MTRRAEPSRSVCDLDAARAALTAALASEPRVTAAYIFGSVALGTAGPLSDVDVALLIDDAVEREAVRDRVTDALTRRLRTASIDVISLPDVPVPVRYRVIRDGVLVLCRDAAARQRFVVDTVMHYLDVEPLRKRAFAVMRRTILENG